MDIRKIIREILEEEFNKNKVEDAIEKLGFELEEKQHAHGYNSYFFFMPFDELEFVLTLVVETYSGTEEFPVEEKMSTAMLSKVDRNRGMKQIFLTQVDTLEEIVNRTKSYVEKYKEQDHQKFLGIEPKKSTPLSGMEQKDLQKLMDKALDKRDFAAAEKIGQYIRQ